jgi:hypothetical protein
MDQINNIWNNMINGPITKCYMECGMNIIKSTCKIGYITSNSKEQHNMRLICKICNDKLDGKPILDYYKSKKRFNNTLISSSDIMCELNDKLGKETTITIEVPKAVIEKTAITKYNKLYQFVIFCYRLFNKKLRFLLKILL